MSVPEQTRMTEVDGANVTVPVYVLQARKRSQLMAALQPVERPAVAIPANATSLRREIAEVEKRLASTEWTIKQRRENLEDEPEMAASIQPRLDAALAEQAQLLEKLNDLKTQLSQPKTEESREGEASESHTQSANQVSPYFLYGMVSFAAITVTTILTLTGVIPAIAAIGTVATAAVVFFSGAALAVIGAGLGKLIQDGYVGLVEDFQTEEIQTHLSQLWQPVSELFSASVTLNDKDDAEQHNSGNDSEEGHTTPPASPDHLVLK